MATWTRPRYQSKRLYMYLPFGNAMVRIFGGPYRDRPANLPGVKMAEEIKAPCDVDIPTRDFDVPDIRTMQWGIAKTLWLLRTRGDIYVGCMGGIGRTGLFMAVLTQVLEGKDGPDAIREVRRQYKTHAVETQQQQDYVADFPIGWLVALRKLLSIGT